MIFKENGGEIIDVTIEKPTYRNLIQIISSKTQEELKVHWGLDPMREDEYIYIHVYVRSFLLTTCLLSGLFVGMISTSAKISSELAKLMKYRTLEAKAFWISGSGLVFSILCNFYNVNVTVSMFS